MRLLRSYYETTKGKTQDLKTSRFFCYLARPLEPPPPHRPSHASLPSHTSLASHIPSRFSHLIRGAPLPKSAFCCSYLLSLVLPFYTSFPGVTSQVKIAKGESCRHHR
ncbi:hypothetical protein IE81DRAFT_326288 [Ceraceosorus guamensis]|uniref:Uncharacterized protein n=1 Tax=Ceraceosorus guamensis TaxID=1522189 RepID=A0A316VW69_9BASI|nr:hypothetical protein IE81DRAFT_326288 [Ceraceosorus guamensis]PWN39695.1 hypothetical protein IE81DRAFT_326288 [Ceraceosorus guamensis]